MAVIHFWKKHLDRGTNAYLPSIKSTLAQISPLLYESAQKYIHSISVAVWPWVYVWQILWHSQKYLPVLLTACLTVSLVHNGFPHSKLLIYSVSTHTPPAHCKENKFRKQVFCCCDDTAGKTHWCWIRLGSIPEEKEKKRGKNYTFWLIYVSWHGSECVLFHSGVVLLLFRWLNNSVLSNKRQLFLGLCSLLRVCRMLCEKCQCCTFFCCF